MKIEFTLYSLPVAQPRHKVMQIVANGKAAGVRHYIDGKHPVHQFKYEMHAAGMEAMAGREPFKGVPMVLGVRFLLPRPARLDVLAGRKGNKRPKFPTGELPCYGKPDLDNLLKAVKDSLNGVIWYDDGQITMYAPETGKWYHAKGAMPCCLVRAWTIDPLESFTAQSDGSWQDVDFGDEEIL